MSPPSIIKDGETLLPGFQAKLINIERGRQIVAFDSHPTRPEKSDPRVQTQIPVIFLHGFPDNVFSYRHVGPIVAATGRRCILLSCPGYDESTLSLTSDGSLDVPCVAKDYSIAIDSILGGKTSSYHLVGHDWGAAHAVYLATKLHSRQVASLTLAAVPHGMSAGFKAHPKEQLLASWYMAFFQLPFLPEWWMLGPFDGLTWLWRRWSPNYDAEAVYFNSVRRTLSQPGVMRSTINMYRDVAGMVFLAQWLILRIFFFARWFIGYGNRPFRFPIEASTQEERDEEAIIFNMPVLGLTGENDGCINTKLFDFNLNDKIDRVYPRGYEVKRFPSAGHFLFSEKPEEVAKCLMEIMAKGDGMATEVKKTEILKADYLVVGAGSTGIAFVDTLLKENKHCQIILVDRNCIPGGHWTISYPFVRLHQPASAYGVNSKRLGKSDLMDPTNLASKDEILTYYKQVLSDFLKTGRVRYFAECEADVENSSFTSLTDANLCYKVKAHKVIDAIYTRVMVPSMRPPPFEIKNSSIVAAPVNDVSKLVKSHSDAEFIVAGGGKTGVDAVLELLRLGVIQSQIIWIIPNDSWYLVRESSFLPELFVPAYVEFFNILFESSTCSEAFMKMEKKPKPFVCRLDTNVTPTIFKAATISISEIPKLQSIKRVIRQGRIVRIEKDTIVFQRGKITLNKKTCLIDCTANGLPPTKPIPVFNGKRIVLQTINAFQSVYSAAMIAFLEANVTDEGIKNKVCKVFSHPVNVEEYLKVQYYSLKTEEAFEKLGLSASMFLFRSRLSLASGVPTWRILWGLFGPQDLKGKIKKFLEMVESGKFVG